MEQNNAGRRMEASQETGFMTDASQTQPSTDTPRADSLQPKTTHRVGCWNVQTLYQTGKLTQVVREMESYNIELLVVPGADQYRRK